jgi:serralysin
VFRTFVRIALALAAGVVALLVSISMTPVAQALPPTELLGTSGAVIPLKNAAMISHSDYGYRYRAGQQNSHLTVTLVDGKLLYADTGTQKWRSLPKSCQRQSVSQGVAALCKIPAKYADGSSMFLEVWPRLGNDYVDGSTLPARFRMWVLADAGNDTVLTGAGDDFVNGAMGVDKVWGGAGDDWIRTGDADDEIWGEAGNDRLVGTDGGDEIHGGDGNDSVEGGNGNDSLYADTGTDIVRCAAGTDDAFVDPDDRANDCESVHSYS